MTKEPFVARPAAKWRCGALLLSWLTAAYFQSPASAHEGHAPLPTKGATVQGDHLLLSASAAKAIDLKTAKIQLGDIRRTISANATVEVPCHHHAFATTMVAGKIIAVLAGPGSSVAAGQELARIESPTLDALQLEMLQASEELALANQLFENRERIASSISSRLLLEARAGREQKAAQFGVAWQKLRSIGVSEQRLNEIRKTGRLLRSLSVSSPISGVVSQVDVRVGQIVEPTEHLYHIIDRSQVWIAADVLESDAESVRIGLPAAVYFDAVKDKVFGTRIDNIGVMVDPRRHVLSVRGTLDNADGKLQANMFGQAVIDVATARQAIICPVDALLPEGPVTFVLVQEAPGKFLRKRLTLGLRTPVRAEVLDGLFPGDEVVTTGNHELDALFGKAATVGAKRAPTNTSKASDKLPDDRPSTITCQAQVELSMTAKAFASSSIQGKILHLLVERGQSVAAGDVLAEIESLELKNWQLDLVQTKVRLRFTKALLDSIQSNSQLLVPEKDLWQMRSNYQTLLHTEQTLIQKLRSVGFSQNGIDRMENIDLADPKAGEQITTVLQVRTPIDGQVAQFELAIGQVVSPHDQMFEIHDLTRVWVKGYLFEQDAGRVRIGQQVEVALVGEPSFSAAGRVTRISPVLESPERVSFVWAELENPEHRLKEGMLARMTIHTGSKGGVSATEGQRSNTSKNSK